MIASLAARAATLTARHADNPSTANRVNLEQQKKRAKDLLKACRVGEPGALAHFAARTKPALQDQPPKLADAQRVIARDLGFSQWEGLRAHIEHAHIAQDALQSGAPSVLDGDARTLHIRCGSDIRDGLTIAGFRGDFLSFAYPFVHGPAVSAQPVSNFIEIGGEFLASVDFTQSKEAASRRLSSEFESLEQAHDYERICLWFEHDAYDQLCLIFLLDWFSKPDRCPRQVDLICIDGYPGFTNFHGLGQLAPDAFRVLWSSRRPVSAGQYHLCQTTWQALIQPAPVALFDLVADGTPALPTLAPAVLRQLQELPSAANGLGLTEQLTLTILEREGPMTAGRLFGRYNNHYEPLPFMGDLGFYNIILRGLAAASSPAIILDQAGDERRRQTVQPTQTAADLLAGRQNWRHLAPTHRWVGGVEIHTGRPNWCWDEHAARPVLVA